jgi:adenylate cyclase
LPASQVKTRRRLFGTTGRTVLLGVATIAAIFAINFRHPAMLTTAELRADDLRMYSRSVTRPPGAVAVVEIDDRSVAEIGRWPWQRGVMAALVSALSESQVSVIGLDLLFPERDTVDRDHEALASRLAAAGISGPAAAAILGPENDSTLAEALKRQGSTYLGYPFQGHYYGGQHVPGLARGAFLQTIRNPPPLTYAAVMHAPKVLPPMITAPAYLPAIPILGESAAGSAFVDVDADIDGVIRSIPAVILFDKQFCVPLFLALADAYRNHAQMTLWLTDSSVERVTMGRTRIPLDELGEMLIDFRGWKSAIPRFSAADVVAHRVPLSALKGKVVLVGLTAHGLGDRVLTPVAGDVPGVEVQAAAVSNVLSGKFVHTSEATFTETLFIGILLGLVMTTAVAWLGAVRSAIAGMALIGIWLAYADYRLRMNGVLIEVITPIMMVLGTYTVLAGYRYVTETLEKRQLRRAFDHYLAPTVIDKLAEDPSQLKLGGEQRVITVMFADLTGFTNASTHMTPDSLTGKVNRYFEFIVTPIDATGGYVERFLGDSALAFWNAPASDSRHAVHAVRSAFNIIDGVRRAREEDEARGDAGFTIKVGINTGPAVVGNIGSENRYSYTAMGEDVNLASRLEGVPPLYGCLIVIGEHTAELARQEFLLRELDWILVKGATRPMTIYQPIAPLEAVTDAQRNIVTRYAQALEHYRARRFAEACAIWDELVASLEPAPSPSSILADRARHFIANPPPPDWDGVLVLTSK